MTRTPPHPHLHTWQMQAESDARSLGSVRAPPFRKHLPQERLRAVTLCIVLWKLHWPVGASQGPPPRLRRLSPGRTLGVTFSSSPPPSTRAQGRPYPEAAARGSETHTGPLTSRTRANHANTVFRLTALRLQWGHGTASGLGRGSHGGGWAGRAVTEAGATQRSPVGLSYEDTRGSRQAPALGSVTTPPWGVWGPGK